MDFENCNPAAQFAIQQSQNSFVIPNATPFIEFDLNVLATGHVGLTIRIFDVTQPLSFAVFNRVQPKKPPVVATLEFARHVFMFYVLILKSFMMHAQ